MVVILRRGKFVTFVDADSVDEGVERWLSRFSDDFEGGNDRLKRFYDEGYEASLVRVTMRSVVV